MLRIQNRHAIIRKVTYANDEFWSTNMTDKAMPRDETLDKLLEFLLTLQDAVRDPETWKKIERVIKALQLHEHELFDGPVSNDILEDLNALKERFHNDPDAADALQKAIDACEKANEDSTKTKLAWALGSGAVGLVLGAIATVIIRG